MKIERCMLVDRLPQGTYRGTIPRYGKIREVRADIDGVPHVLTMDEPVTVDECTVIVATNGEVSVSPYPQEVGA